MQALEQAFGASEGSATIPNHVDGPRNHLESLLESENQVEILESRIIISMFILGYLVFSVHYESCDAQALIWEFNNIMACNGKTKLVCNGNMQICPGAAHQSGWAGFHLTTFTELCYKVK